MTVKSTDPQLPPDETEIWRFMNAAKFARMLAPFADHAAWGIQLTKPEQSQSAGQLWFGYPWSFNDRFEGKLPSLCKKREKYIEKVIKRKGIKGKEAAALRDLYLSVSNEHLFDAIEATANLYGASCWQMHDNVDPKMWKFSRRHSRRNNNGVAIRSTVGLIITALRSAQNYPARARPEVCKVGYVSHGVYFTLNDGAKGILSIVRSKYKHQSEVRFMARSPYLARINFKVAKSYTFNLSEPTAFASKEEATDHFRKSLGPFTNEGAEFQHERVDEILKAAAPLADKIEALSKRVRYEKNKGFELPLSLPGVLHEVVVSPDSEAGYEAEVERLLENAGCKNVPVRRGRMAG